MANNDYNNATFQGTVSTSSIDEDSVPSTPSVVSPMRSRSATGFHDSDTSLSSGGQDDHHEGRRFMLSVHASATSYDACIRGSRSAPSSPLLGHGPRFKLMREGPVHVCRLNYTRTLVSKILSSKFLRRWEIHQLQLTESCILAKNPSGFMDEPVPFSSILDVYPVARWDSCGRFCIRVVIPDGSLLLQVANSYVRDQWLHSLLWKKSVFRFKKMLASCMRPEILLKELQSLVDLALSTPLQDEEIFQISLDIISDVLVKGQSWMSRSVAEEVITTVASLLERTTPTSDICTFLMWHCRENPRSTVVLDLCTPIVQRILKHNMDFGRHPQTRAFVQEYLLAVNCQNNGDKIIRDFVQCMHGHGITCPHPRVLHNLVAISVAAVHSIFENRRIFYLGGGNNDNNEIFSAWEMKLQCFVLLFQILATFDDWRPLLAELLQPIPFHDDALVCCQFTSPFKEVISKIGQDNRCGVHQMILEIREEKGGWLHLYCPGGIACDDEGHLWSTMLDKLLSCCCRRRAFLQSLVKSLGPCILRALRGDEVCQRTLCIMLEMEVVENHDMQLQLISTLQSTTSGKAHYADLCLRQMHLRQLQQKGGPKKLALPSRSTDDDVSRLLSSGSFGDLECLSLAFTQVTSACAEQLIKLPSLRYLNLWSTQFGDSGLELISEHLPNLQVLNLCETLVTDKGLAALTGLKNLKKLNLNSTDLTAYTFERIKLRFLWDSSAHAPGLELAMMGAAMLFGAGAVMPQKAMENKPNIEAYKGSARGVSRRF